MTLREDYRMALRARNLAIEAAVDYFGPGEACSPPRGEVISFDTDRAKPDQAAVDVHFAYYLAWTIPTPPYVLSWRRVKLSPEAVGVLDRVKTATAAFEKARKAYESPPATAPAYSCSICQGRFESAEPLPHPGHPMCPRCTKAYASEGQWRGPPGSLPRRVGPAKR